MSEPNTINDTTIDKTKREIFVLRKEGYAVSIPYNRVDALKQIAGEHTTLSEEHADLTAKLKLAEEEVADLNRTFEMVHEAEMRGIKMWRAENPDERNLKLPDTAHFVVWLLNRIEFNETVFAEMQERESSVTAKLKLAVEALEQIRDSDVHTAIEWVANNALKQIGEQR